MTLSELRKLFTIPESAALEGILRTKAPADEERVIIGFTNFGAGPIVDGALYKAIGKSDGGGVFVRESLIPIPLASVSLSETSLPTWRESLLKFARSTRGTVRIIAAKGFVQYGSQGASNWFAFGSSGPAVSAVLEACFALPRDQSWIENSLAEAVQFRTGTMVSAGDHLFTSCNEVKNP